MIVKQRITFVGTLEIDGDAVGWHHAEVVVQGALLEGANVNSDRNVAKVARITKLEMIEGE